MASVLVIDDYDGTLATYSRILRLAGFEVATASNGRAGIELATSRAFDVHLVDLRLPDLSGIEVVREFRLGGVSGRTVIVTAFPAFESAFEAAAVGADGYVDGVLFGDEVVEVVTQALRGPYPIRHPSWRRAPELTGVSLVEAPLPIDRRVREVMQLIDADLAVCSDLSDLAGRVDLSESGLRHLFRANTGQSIGQYRHERRLQEAARLISTTHDDIRQIAHRLGFRSTSHGDFRKAFRARFGVSPKVYRETWWRGST